MINDSDKMIMAKNIQKLMDINNKSRQDLCNALGFKYSTLSEWLQAKKYPRADKISKLASYFNVSRSELVDPPSQSNINIGTNNGAVSGSGNATVIECPLTDDKLEVSLRAMLGDSVETDDIVQALTDGVTVLKDLDDFDRQNLRLYLQGIANVVKKAKTNSGD